MLLAEVRSAFGEGRGAAIRPTSASLHGGATRGIEPVYQTVSNDSFFVSDALSSIVGIGSTLTNAEAVHMAVQKKSHLFVYFLR